MVQCPANHQVFCCCLDLSTEVGAKKPLCFITYWFIPPLFFQEAEPPQEGYRSSFCLLSVIPPFIVVFGYRIVFKLHVAPTTSFSDSVDIFLLSYHFRWFGDSFIFEKGKYHDFLPPPLIEQFIWKCTSCKQFPAE